MSLHSTGMGKICLARMSNEDLKKYFSYKKMKKITPNTIVDIKLMKEQLRLVRREGVAYELQENSPDANGVAAEIKNIEGETVGAISIIGHPNRLNQAMMNKLIPVLKSCASKISVELDDRL